MPPGLATATTLIRKAAKREQKTRGRPRKRKHEDEHDAIQPKRRGGGGAWRCFLHEFLQGRSFTSEDMRVASMAYGALAAEEKERYMLLGRLGSSPKTKLN
eukprot:6222513-Amphidinium_carterae.1